MSPRVALVTGASSGIGRSIVLRLVSEGWTVYGGARRVERMTDIGSRGFTPLFLDVTDDESMQGAVQTILTGEGRIDALVNNAGYGAYGALEDVGLDEARRQFEVNVFGLVRLTQLVLPAMREQGSGTVVNVSSMGGRIWMPVGGWYHATKHAVEVLSDALRMEVAAFGIDVVVIQPGAIQSEWSEIAADTLEESSEGTAYPQLVEGMTHLLRDYDSAASPDVVADAVSRALSSRTPRRRYRVPFHAKAYVFLRWLLPDRAWEGLVRRTFRQAREKTSGSAGPSDG